MLSKEVLNGPCGIMVELDASEIHPDDPGAGTPALVVGRNGNTATFWCALETGEIDDRPLPSAVLDWLGSNEAYVGRWLEKWSTKISEVGRAAAIEAPGAGG